MVTLPWLRDGRLLEPIPGWFIDLFLRTRDISATSKASDAFGMSTVEQNWCLYRLAADARPTRSLEIGVCRGATSLVIARSLLDHAIRCRHTAVDIDPTSIEAVKKHFTRENMSGMLHAITEDSRAWLPQQDMRWQFVFLDGDHAYDTVAFEFVETYNRLDVGGWVVLHDVGSVRWGLADITGPGRLLFTALDKELANHAEIGWLDSAELDQELMVLRSKGFQGRIRTTVMALADGWGGLGLVRKTDDALRATHEALRRYRFPDPPAPPAGRARPPHLAPLPRFARTLRRMVFRDAP